MKVTCLEARHFSQVPAGRLLRAAKLPSVKVRCITGWADESHAILALALGSSDADDAQSTITDKAMQAIQACTERPGSDLLRFKDQNVSQSDNDKGPAALTSGGASAPAVLELVGWRELGKDYGGTLWYNGAQCTARGGVAYLRRGELNEKKSSPFCSLIDRQPISTT